ncbi:MAG: hypothetical protein R2684_09460 [Pyrinomonadaceae bacterium]
MKDYLWNKKGSDPEIERLENTLAVFRQPIPEKESARNTEIASSWFSKLSWAWLIPATAAAATLLFAVFAWTSASSGFDESNADMASAEQFNKEKVSANEPQLPNLSNGKRAELSDSDEGIAGNPSRVNPRSDHKSMRIRFRKRERESGFRKATFRSPTGPRQRKPRDVLERPVATKAKFSDEEIRAYNELLRALSITSDSLRRVREKVDGTDPVTD